MKHFRIALAATLLTVSFAANALLEDLNHFALSKSGANCVLQLEPQRDALNVAFTSPSTLEVQSSYEFIGGSGITLNFDDGSSVLLTAQPSSSNRQITATIPADKMAGFSSNAHVKIGSESIRGPLFRRIKLTGFADGYSGLQACIAP